MKPQMETIHIPEPLNSVISACLDCDPYINCCGLDSLDIHPQWIRQWLEFNSQADLDVAHKQVEEMIEYLSIEEREVYFPNLDDGGSSAFYVDLLTQWKTAIENAPATDLPPVPQPETAVQKFRRSLVDRLTAVIWITLLSAPVVLLIALIYWLLGWL